jgi:hypothetical protein
MELFVGPLWTVALLNLLLSWASLASFFYVVATPAHPSGRPLLHVILVDLPQFPSK